jgi:hypothetical protein
LTISPATRQSPPFAGIVLYDFVLSNNGPGTVANGHEWAHLTATSPAGASAASSLFAASACTVRGDGSVNCFWPLPSGGLPPGASASVQLSVRGLVGRFALHAQLAGDFYDDTTPSNNDADILGTARDLDGDGSIDATCADANGAPTDYGPGCFPSFGAAPALMVSVARGRGTKTLATLLYSVVNAGNASLTDVVLHDDHCPAAGMRRMSGFDEYSPPGFLSRGDTDDVLEARADGFKEQWEFACQYAPRGKPGAKLVHHVTASAQFGEQTASSAAQLTTKIPKVHYKDRNCGTMTVRYHGAATLVGTRNNMGIRCAKARRDLKTCIETKHAPVGYKNCRTGKLFGGFIAYMQARNGDGRLGAGIVKGARGRR